MTWKRWIVLSAALTAGVVFRMTAVLPLQTVEARNSPFVADRAFADLKAMVAFGPRPSGSAANVKTRAYIVAELQKAGLKPLLDEFDVMTPRGMRHMVNIRAIRPGARPATTIALAGHFDTKAFDFSFVGADDGGSSAAWLLEMARATAGLKLQSSLEFIFLDGEEAVVDWTKTDSVYGSRYDVERRTREKTLAQLKAFILVDMIGDRELDLRREPYSTNWLTAAIWDTAHSLGYNKQFLNDPLPVEDDHVPYLMAGVPATDLIDFNYAPWHTAADTLDKMSGESLRIVADAVYFSLEGIDARVNAGK